MRVSERNGFDSLRLIGSLIVLVGHAFLITGSTAPMIGTVPLYLTGVYIFFTISGYLITQSWLADGNARRFLLRRGLRIFPALFVVTVLTALLIGPYATTEPLTRYFHHGWIYRYIVSNTALVTVWGLPGVFETLPLPRQVNGSLWTLPIEFGLYLLTPLLVTFHRVAGKTAIAVIVAASLLVVGAEPHFPGVFGLNIVGIDIGHGLSVAPWFWLGSALRLANFVRWRHEHARIVLAGSAVALIIWACVATRWQLSLLTVIAPAAVVILAVGLKDWLHSRTIERVGDLSYGIYLWAFPLQQLVVAKTGGGAGQNIAIALPATVVLAYASWHLVERPALRFKPKRRGRAGLELSPAISEAALQTPGGG